MEGRVKRLVTEATTKEAHMWFRVAATASLFFSVLGVLPAAAQDVYLPSAQVTPPRLITSVQPPKSSWAHLGRIMGVVRLQVDVRPNGTVGTVALVRPMHPLLVRLAIEAVRKWQYAPGMKDRKPVTVRIDATIEFILP